MSQSHKFDLLKDIPGFDQVIVSDFPQAINEIDIDVEQCYREPLSPETFHEIFAGPNKTGHTMRTSRPLLKKAYRNRDTIDFNGKRFPVFPHDVVSGKGRSPTGNPGNFRFDKLIEHYARKQESEGRNLDLDRLQVEVMAQLLPGARMMTQYCHETNTALVLTLKGIRRKIGQAIRYKIRIMPLRSKLEQPRCDLAQSEGSAP